MLGRGGGEVLEGGERVERVERVGRRSDWGWSRNENAEVRGEGDRELWTDRAWVGFGRLRGVFETRGVLAESTISASSVESARSTPLAVLVHRVCVGVGSGDLEDDSRSCTGVGLDEGRSEVEGLRRETSEPESESDERVISAIGSRWHCNRSNTSGNTCQRRMTERGERHERDHAKLTCEFRLKELRGLASGTWTS